MPWNLTYRDNYVMPNGIYEWQTEKTTKRIASAASGTTTLHLDGATREGDVLLHLPPPFRVLLQGTGKLLRLSYHLKECYTNRLIIYLVVGLLLLLLILGAILCHAFILLLHWVVVVVGAAVVWVVCGRERLVRLTHYTTHQAPLQFMLLYGIYPAQHCDATYLKKEKDI